MVGILIVTHGEFGKALISSAELIMGKRENLDALELNFGDNTDDLKIKIIDKIRGMSTLNEAKEVLVLVDMFGGSPSNSTAFAINELRNDINVECITGVNLPMLLEVSSMSSAENLASLREIALRVGCESIMCLKTKVGM